MSELQELDVTIWPNGEIKIEVRGVKGPSCLAVTRELEALLGDDVRERDLTDEYREQGNTLTDEERLRQGRA